MAVWFIFCGLTAALLLPGRAGAATFTVSNITDSDPGSLRQAILDANASPDLDTIVFDIGTAGSQQTIQPLSALPTISDPVILDGWSQGGDGYTGPPLVEINGSLLADWNLITGLNITAGGSTVRGLAVNYFNIAISLGSAGGNVIAGNIIGLALDGSTPIGNRTGIRIAATSDGNRIGTDGDGVNDAAERNVISASGYVQQNNSHGILIDGGSDNNWIAGNYIGTDAGGTLDRGNSASGIVTGGVTIIGTNGDGQGDAQEGNLISGNGGHGIALSTSASGSTVAGNQIGTDITGTAAIANGDNGVSVSPCSPGQCSDHMIGTNGDGVSDALEGNLISGNGDSGVYIPAGTLDGNVIAGNKIGTDISGAAALPNGDYGAHLGGDFSRLGTNSDGVSDSLESNLISGNDNHGVFVPSGADHHLVAGNRIGTNADGTAALPNGQAGVYVGDDHNTVTGNLVSGNGGHGIQIADGFYVTVTNNLIGTAIDGLAPLGNTLHGLMISINSDDNTIGGPDPGQGNTIAFNGGDGVFVDNNCGSGFCLRNRITGNSIFENAGLGIDLHPDGVNANDPLDPDIGPNGRQNYPVIDLVAVFQSQTTIAGILESISNTTYILSFYYSPAADPSGHGEGQHFIGQDSVATGASGQANFSPTFPVAVPAGQYVTATATDPAGNTSEFSAAFGPTSGGGNVQPISGLSASNNSPHYRPAVTQLSAGVASGTEVSYLWDLGDGSNAGGPVVEHTYSAAGLYTATVTASNSVNSQQAATVVTIWESASINGVLFYDGDGDGRRIAESGAINGVVTASGPGGVFTATTTSGSIYSLTIPVSGTYQITATVSSPSLFTTPNPRQLPVSTSGSVAADFGYINAPQPGKGHIIGRLWVDANGNGLFDAGESNLSNQSVRLYQNGAFLGSSITSYNGLYIFENRTPGIYRLEATIGAYVPHPMVVDNVIVAADDYVAVPMPFVLQSVIGGQVYDSSGLNLGGATLTLSQAGSPPQTRTTSSYGVYQFSYQSAGTYTLTLTLPANYVTADGQYSRIVTLPTHAFVTENWPVQFNGRLWIWSHTDTEVVGGVDFTVAAIDGSPVLTATTDTNGQAFLDGLPAETYLVTPDPASLPPDTVIDPGQRLLAVNGNTASIADFTLRIIGTLVASCRRAGNVTASGGFACTVEVSSGGSIVVSATLPASAPDVTFPALPAGTYDVTLTPAPSGWPVHHQVATVSGGGQATVNYPYNPSDWDMIVGVVYHDRCQPFGQFGNSPTCSGETNSPDANGLTVTLTDGAGTVVATTTTAQGSAVASGLFNFPNLAPGDYTVSYELPAGAQPTGPTSQPVLIDLLHAPPLVTFGFQPDQGDLIRGRAFVDQDASGDYSTPLDTLWPGAAITVTTTSGQYITSTTTASDGSFLIQPLTSGLYQVAATITDADGPTTLTRFASLPAGGPSPVLDFAFSPPGSRSRVLIFLDGNGNGLYDGGEQRFAGVQVQLFGEQCGLTTTALETAVSDGGGEAVFNSSLPVPPTAPACAKAVNASLPPGTVVASPAGVNLPRGDGTPRPLPLAPSGSLVVIPFWDADGDGRRDVGEPAVGPGTATAGGQSRPYTALRGATFLLPAGSYNLSLTVPAGYQVAIAQPAAATITAGTSTSRLVPLRQTGGLGGQITGALNGQTSLMIQLDSVTGRAASSQTTATCATAACLSLLYSFTNVTAGSYRLTLVNPPLQTRLAFEPIVVQETGQVTQQPLEVVLIDAVVGVVYQDDNSNGQRDPGEPGLSDRPVVLLDSAGLPDQTMTPVDGAYQFAGLTIGSSYLVTISSTVSGNPYLWDTITEAPGWFTAGSQQFSFSIGIAPGSLSDWKSAAYGRVLVEGDPNQPLPGARVVYYTYHSVLGCGQSSPLILGETFSNAQGYYKLYMTVASPDVLRCVKVVDVPGFTHPEPAVVRSGVLLYGSPWPTGEPADLTVEPATLRAGQGGPAVTWRAFRDDNVNGQWDGSEPLLPGAILSSGTISSTSGPDGRGRLEGLADGIHLLAITSPAGYAPAGPVTRTLVLSGSDVVVPALPFRFAGVLVGRAHIDSDGDGWPGAGSQEPGLGNVTVTLAGPVVTTTITALDGRFALSGLPDGVYTVTAVPPAGFSTPPPQTITLVDGGQVSLALRAADQVNGVLYLDWDGDGLRLSDEMLVVAPYTVTLGSTPMRVTAGAFHFWDVAPGTYTVGSAWSAVDPVQVTVTAGSGKGLALAAANPAVVRGVVWLDADGDGLRQPWETPLAGIIVTLDGNQAAETDEHGRYHFFGVATGSHSLVASLPAGWQTPLAAFTTTSGRGAAIGLPVTPADAPVQHRVYLPVVRRP